MAPNMFLVVIRSSALVVSRGRPLGAEELAELGEDVEALRAATTSRRALRARLDAECLRAGVPRVSPGWRNTKERAGFWCSLRFFGKYRWFLLERWTPPSSLLGGVGLHQSLLEWNNHYTGVTQLPISLHPCQ